ncbi:rhomboid family intramembrane serine protease [Criibacterium bergeronii]|uniref:Rhomboid family intramembrane serine protease n=1 Tax=Criibacterium bergeronii TaxID=1871336 RepID=A0A371ILF6_9FIRM|nr:rhomboid family intramembrane serine protease [Criibacterium bergeronii]MBS6062661.1 rhomboid family intramembrane serine protease [Peptostreptococcaceae bacterium]RDY21322.1 rhomboid family protein [Criibacterium bergeronii]TRW27968.1 rhomboid family intramembrane serine protease [Criibacterium bergeronii]
MINKKITAIDAIIVVNVIIFLIMTLAGGTTNTEVLLRFGAMYKPYIIVDGEFYRFITAMFIHIGLVHLLMNMFVLKTMGPTFERLFGTKNFVIIYILSGIMGNIMGFGFGSVRSVEAGASTSIYGLMGIILGLYFFYKEESNIKYFAKQYFPFIVISLIYSITDPRVSVLGHLGGLIGGFLMTGIFDIPYHKLPTKTHIIFSAAYVVLGAIFLLIGYITAFTLAY